VSGATGCVRRSCLGMTGTECQGGDCCAGSMVIGGTATLILSAGSTSATIATFALDKFEVTVGRFQRFVDAYTGPPAKGAGAHPLIPGSGWQSPDWDTKVEKDGQKLESDVQCGAGFYTWKTAGANDQLPMDCVSWYDAFAFCAWDGGRLPTTAEWTYAAAGGTEQRTYPWGSTPEPDRAHAVFGCTGDGPSVGDCAFTDILTVGSKPLGVGKYGQLDLAGSMAEWTLDWQFGLPPTCDNCANLSFGSARTVNGGDWAQDASSIATGSSAGDLPDSRDNGVGFRCAHDL